MNIPLQALSLYSLIILMCLIPEVLYAQDENRPLPANKFPKYNGPHDEVNFTLSGIVKDAKTGEVLPYATIVVKGTTNGTTTNTDGFFSLNQVPTDTSTLTVTYMGYQSTDISLSPQMPKINMVLEIQPNSVSLGEVVVQAEREDVMKINPKEVSTIKMTPKQLNKLPNLGEKDIMRSFQLMPGISASNESSSGLYVRGGTPDQNLILYDGFTIYHVDHLYGFFSAFNSNAIKDVQLYKGGFESRFGGRLSSVTEITGKNGNQNNFNIGGEVSLLSMNAFAEVPIGDKFTSIVAFRRSYKGFIYNKIFDQYNDDNSQSGPSVGGGPGGFSSQETQINSYFYDLNGKFTYRPNEKDIISLSVFNGTDNLDNSFELSTPSRLADRGINLDMKITDLTNYGNFGSSLKWSRKWNPKLYGNTIVSYSNYYSERELSRSGSSTNISGETTNRSSGILESNDLKDFSFKSDYQWDISKSIQIEGGGFASYFDISYNYTQNDTVSILDKQDYGLLAGGYLQTKIKMFNNKVQLLPGIRTSYFNETNKLYYEPRASLIINLTDKLNFNAAYGKYYQFANRVVREDITSGSRDFWILSDDEDVPVSSSTHYIAGLSYETKDYLFSAEGYYKQLDGLSEYSLRFDASFQGVNYLENFYTGQGYARGLELLAQKKYGKLTGWVSYTIGEARNQFDIYGENYFPAIQDVTHEVKWVGMYKHKRWNFSATWIYATGRPYTAPAGAYTITLLDGSTQEYFTTSSKNGLRLPDYHRLDLSVNYKLYSPSSENEIGYLGLSLFNAYNRTNTWYNQYEIVEGEVIETQINYLGLTPNITLSLKLR